MSAIGHNGGPPMLAGNDGWVAIARSMRDHAIVGFHLHAKPADANRGAMQPALAFIDLIMECRYEDGTVMNGGRKMIIQRGELVGAISWLAARWNWTPKAVRGWLDRLETDGMIARFQRSADGVETGLEKGNQKGNQAAILRLCNYEIYQTSRMSEWQSNRQSSGNRRAIEGQSKGNIYKDKQGNKGTKEQEEEKDLCAAEAAPCIVETAFENFWAAFPADRRRGKGKCRDLFRQIVTGKHKARRATADQIVAAVVSGIGIDPEFPPMPETWLSQGRWEDATAAAPPSGEPEPEPVNGKKWGWWQGLESKLRAYPIEKWRDAVLKHKPNGTWPWWVLGAPPGHPECVMPSEIIAENRYIEIYRGKIHHA